MKGVRGGNFLFRADAGPAVGYGHALRSLALARACRKSGGRVVFFLGGGVPAVERKVRESGARLRRVARSYPAKEDLKVLRAESAARPRSWAVVDGYRFDVRFQRGLRAAGGRLAVFDDTEHLPEYEADLIINQNAGAQTLAYRGAPGALKLVGARYTLIRDEFRRARARMKPLKPVGRRVLVAFGGSDPLDISGKVLRAMGRLRLPGLRATVLLGASNPHAEELKSLAARLPFSVEIAVDAPDVAARMSRADAVAAAGGVTSREAAFLGIPSLVGYFVENQRLSAEGLAAAGAAISLGDWRKASEARIASALARLLRDGPLRRRLGSAGRRLVDGEGAARVLRIFSALSVPKKEPFVRKAVLEDIWDVWRIAGEPGVRAHSFAKGPIPRRDHERWFRRILSSKRQVLFILEGGGVPAGVVRYSLEKGRMAEAHFSLHPAFRGMGWAGKALAATWPEARRRLGARAAFGTVILPNPASEKAFERAGYVRAGERTLHGKICAIYALASVRRRR